MRLLYFVNGVSVDRQFMAMHLGRCIGGDPYILMQNYEEAAMNYFYETGATIYEDARVGISIVRAW